MIIQYSWSSATWCSRGHLHYICVEVTHLVVQAAEALNKQQKETIEPNRVVGIGSHADSRLDSKINSEITLGEKFVKEKI